MYMSVTTMPLGQDLEAGAAVVIDGARGEFVRAALPVDENAYVHVLRWGGHKGDFVQAVEVTAEYVNNLYPVYENYYYEDEELLHRGANYGALVHLPRRWSGLPVAPLNLHPASHVSTEETEWLGNSGNRRATRAVLASALSLEALDID